MRILAIYVIILISTFCYSFQVAVYLNNLRANSSIKETVLRRFGLDEEAQRPRVDEGQI